MTPTETSCPEEHGPTPKPSRTEEARRVVEEYANDLGEIVKKLGKRFFH